MLKNQLNKAFNQNTGKLDLSKLRESFEKTDMSLEKYYEKMRALGPEGQKAFLQVAGAITKAETPAINLGKRFDELWVTMKNTMRWQLTSSALHGFIGGIQSAYGYAQDLNKSLTDIRIVSGQSAEQMGEFAQQANEAAKSLSSTTTAYTNASLIYYQQGLVGEAVTERADATIKMANVTGDTAEEVSNQLTAIWNNFYDGSKSIEYYADVITALGAATASSTSEISDGLEKFASIADAVGLSYEYATAALATVTATTRQSAETVGTAFKTLFARIQGLKLGETLEDGVDLNKYSEALNAVGISILDQKGELRNMDVLLNELGEKWNTISKAQRIALAETVAGVRQYTQLVALMDNWDYFKQNLMVAQGSEGALQEQADIYAESWVAAGKRAQAAAQGVYDSLLNDDVFIAIADATTGFLSGLEQVIDTMGGLGGVAALVANLMLKVYGDKAIGGLQSIAKNIRIITGEEERLNQEIKKQISETTNRMLSEKESTSAYVDNMKRVLKLNQDLEKIKNNITQEDYELLQAEINIFDVQSQKLAKTLEENEALREQMRFKANEKLISSVSDEDLNEAKKVIQTKINANKTFASQQAAINSVANKMIDTQGNQLNKTEALKKARGTILKLEKDYYDQIVQIDKQYGKISQTIKNVEKISNQWKNGIDDVENKLKFLAKNIKEITNIDVDQIIKTGNLEKPNEILKKIVDKLKQARSEGKDFNQVLDRLNIEADIIATYGKIPENFQRASEQAIKLGMEEANCELAANGLNNAFKTIGNTIDTATGKTRNLEERIVALAQISSSAAMNFQLISSTIRELADKDSSAFDKFLSVFTMIAMFLPDIITDFKILNTVLNLNEAKIASVVAKTVGATASISAFGKAAQVAGRGLTILGKGIGALAGPLGWFITFAAPLGAIIKGIFDMNEEISKQTLEENKKQIEQQKAEIISNEELINNYQKAYEVYKETGKGKQELFDATQKLKENLKLEENEVINLSGSYEQLNKELEKKKKLDLIKNQENLKKEIKNIETELKDDEKISKAKNIQGIIFNKNQKDISETTKALKDTEFLKLLQKKLPEMANR